MPPEKKIRGKYLYSPQSGIIKNFLVTVEGGFIKSVDKIQGVDFSSDYDIGNSVLLPGFINAHCHLELTGFRDKLRQGSSFSRWVEDIIHLKLETSNKDFGNFIEEGILEGIKGGCTFFSDISGSHLSASFLEKAGVRGIVFYETIGYKKNDCESLFQRLNATIKNHRQKKYKRVSPGISPHSVYSVSKNLFEKCAELAVSESLPVQVHVAETAQETLFLEKGEGHFFSLLSFLGQIDEQWRPEGVSPVQFMKKTGLLNEKNSLVHLNNCSEQEFDLLSESNISVVVCPSSNNNWFGRNESPVMDCVRRGINLTVGTDGCASNNRLNIFDELRMLKKIYPSLPGEELIAAVTLNGAFAFGMTGKLGNIAPGFYADMISVPLDCNSGINGLLDDIIERTEEVNFSMVGGNKIYSCL